MHLPPSPSHSDIMLALETQRTNLSPLDRFPDYVDPFEVIKQPPIMSSALPKPKILANIQSEESSRGPSPQPTHFSVPLLSHSNGNGNRTLRSATVGYVAPEFTGKLEQMKTGM